MSFITVYGGRHSLKAHTKFECDRYNILFIVTLPHALHQVPRICLHVATYLMLPSRIRAVKVQDQECSLTRRGPRGGR